ncbi:hypothetical protein PIB30_020329 [Stylosanthes scabra]|uniref:Transposase MuDR plant domain-containing protein n=1 Tax=Stylosanthes scabra TaxID=79078 RepID=A0ABU6Y7G4_9FABA|nr:hypothetical protein [Stylosanthes scabra]
MVGELIVGTEGAAEAAMLKGYHILRGTRRRIAVGTLLVAVDRTPLMQAPHRCLQKLMFCFSTCVLMGDPNFTIDIHHGGKFHDIGQDFEYLGGEGLVKVEVEGEPEPSSEEDKFDDSANDCDHEDRFVFDVKNAYGGEAAGDEAGGVEVDATGDESSDEISDKYETEKIDSYKGVLDDIIKKKRYSKQGQIYVSGSEGNYLIELWKKITTLSIMRPKCIEIIDFKWAWSSTQLLNSEKLGLSALLSDGDIIKMGRLLVSQLIEHAWLNGIDIRYKKNNRVKCQVVCKGIKRNCKWMCFASKVGENGRVQIKILKGRHTCGRDPDGSVASSSWIAKKITNHIS